MTDPQSLSTLRKNRWQDIPQSPGVYWWFFPENEIHHLRVAEFCDVSHLQLRHASDGKVCLYHGMAKNLAMRVEWHAAQKLTQGCLKCGILSTFRFTLLALNNFDYPVALPQINGFFDNLSVCWQTTGSRDEASVLERDEFRSGYHYPLNIKGNRRPEILEFVRYLKATRKAYKRRFVQANT